ncbi:MAG: hypothetical protein GWN18_06870 [Thermoplasmata archaeon]|nr:hypothetical protein [Thermoplasmata archaeon]NIS11801.1 hypothetical protein [Thermoplasmata archaeon]NIS19686.1 hypothetical protein [Thermoplasmata archaeon]NIT76868.1 hypothetical protein [Thermoplasmata archaeon]NIU48797.1 hypothetical protein [Thermoplasmata archaeon]
MLFVTHMSTLPGRYSEAIRTLKNPKIPNGVEIREYLGTFSHFDAIVIFEAPDEATAVEFVGQFAELFKTETAVAFPPEGYKWTR